MNAPPDYHRRAEHLDPNSRSIFPYRISWLPTPHSRRPFSDFRQPSEVVIRRTCPLGRDHAGTDRCFGRTSGPEDLALPGFFYAFQNLTALAGFRIGDAQSRNDKAGLSVEPAVRLLQPQPTVRDRTQAAP